MDLITIETPIEITLLGPKGSKVVWPNRNRDQILYLRLNAAHPEYSKYCRETTKDILPEGTLRGYLQSRPYYVGAIKSKRFKNAASSCFAFNLSTMSNEDNLILSLPKLEPLNTVKPVEKNPPQFNEDGSPKETTDDLPF